MSDQPTESRVAYFGFGSLVNKHTLRTDYLDIVPARLKGWHRHWQARTRTFDEDVALLSIHQDENAVIDGMIVIDATENLEAVDEREVGYTRQRLDLSNVELLAEIDLPDKVFVYVADAPLNMDNPDGGPLMQSYLDAVMQGYYNEFGEEGLAMFIQTTKGFERAILQDRSKPLYPRSVVLSDHEQALFDQLLNRAGVIYAT